MAKFTGCKPEPDCSDNFDYFLESMCFGRDGIVFWQWFFIFVYIFEVVVAFWLIKKSLVKIKKLKVYDPLNPDSKTYSNLSANVLFLVRVKLAPYCATRFLLILNLITFGNYGKAHYKENEQDMTEIYHNLCICKTKGHWVVLDKMLLWTTDFTNLITIIITTL